MCAQPEGERSPGDPTLRGCSRVFWERPAPRRDTRVSSDHPHEAASCHFVFVGHWAKIASELPHRTGSQCLSKWKIMARVRLYRKSEGPAPVGSVRVIGKRDEGGRCRRWGEKGVVWYLAPAPLLRGEGGETWPGVCSGGQAPGRACSWRGLRAPPAPWSLACLRPSSQALR